MVKVVGIIQPVQTEELAAEGDDYMGARDALIEQVPEGWRLLAVRTDR